MKIFYVHVHTPTACIHTYIHTCIHTYMHTYIHTYMHACMHTYIVHHSAYMCVCIYANMSIEDPWHVQMWKSSLSTEDRVMESQRGIGLPLRRLQCFLSKLWECKAVRGMAMHERSYLHMYKVHRNSALGNARFFPLEA